MSNGVEIEYYKYNKEVLKDADVIKDNIENENHTENVSESINLWGKNFSKRSNRHKTTSKRKVDSDKEAEEFNCMKCDFSMQ